MPPLTTLVVGAGIHAVSAAIGLRRRGQRVLLPHPRAASRNISPAIRRACGSGEDYTRLMLAKGGSGHGPKFGPKPGRLIADVTERRESGYTQKFRWRPKVRGQRSEEESCYNEAL